MSKPEHRRLRALRGLVRGRWWLGIVVAAGLIQLVYQASLSAPPPPPSDVAGIRAAGPQDASASPAADRRYDLERDEMRGGHTLARHVGLSDVELSERLRRERRISAASTYTDQVTAERVVAMALEQHRARVDAWLSREGPRPNLTLSYHVASDEPIGRSLVRRARQPADCSDALVVLRWDGQGGFYVLTSYPELRR